MPKAQPALTDVQSEFARGFRDGYMSVNTEEDLSREYVRGYREGAAMRRATQELDRPVGKAVACHA